MTKDGMSIEQLDNEEITRLIIDMLHRTIIHYGLWFTEVRHQLGTEKALDVLGTTFEKSLAIQLKRLSKICGFDINEKGIPTALLDMKREALLELLKGVSVNWLANDGVWFQSVEFKNGMNDAKRCNDSCWAQFSPFEAWSIKRFLSLGEQPGLSGLKQALNFRLYAGINTQSFVEENSLSLVFQMNECRVQAARKRKNLEDYPCKSGGLVEYTTFASAIDKRIETECIGCPPDDHPSDWYCSWRFTLKE
jgi:hypothetical protein